MADPQWLSRPFDECATYVDQSSMLVLLSRYAVAELREGDWLDTDYAGMPTDGLVSTSTLERRQDAGAIAGLAKDEVAHDFALLHAHSVVGIWGAMDAWIHDLLASWIRRVPQSFPLLADFLGNTRGQVKVKLDAQSLLHGTQDAVAVTLVDAVVATLKDQGGRARGVEWFEGRLRAVGLGRQDDDLPESARLLLSMEIVRHAYAHSAGHPAAKDERILEDAGLWFHEGRVMIGSDEYDQYVEACLDYVSCIRQRTQTALAAIRKASRETA